MTPIDRKHISIWLFSCCAVMLLIVWIGGITRLTESGLSIVEWKPVSGIIPPIGELAWQAEFSKYQQSPEYKLINNGMTLSAFKSIFALEYTHRLIARFIGGLFFFPFIYFALYRKLSSELLTRFSLIFVLGGIQGAIGWYMVKSGLQHDPSVSQYRLAAHLGTGFLIYGLLLWNALSLLRPNPVSSHATTRKLLCLTLVMIFLQVLSGALVAKLHAGLIYNTFPLMDGKWIPSGMLTLSPWSKNLFENVTTVQFTHRLIAATVTSLILGIVTLTHLKSTNKTIKFAVHMMAIMLLLQLSLGIATLLGNVPIVLASMHQVGALLLFSLALISLHTMSYNNE